MGIAQLHLLVTQKDQPYSQASIVPVIARLVVLVQYSDGSSGCEFTMLSPPPFLCCLVEAQEKPQTIPKQFSLTELSRTLKYCDKFDTFFFYKAASISSTQCPKWIQSYDYFAPAERNSVSFHKGILLQEEANHRIQLCCIPQIYHKQPLQLVACNHELFPPGNQVGKLY